MRTPATSPSLCTCRGPRATGRPRRPRGGAERERKEPCVSWVNLRLAGAGCGPSPRSRETLQIYLFSAPGKLPAFFQPASQIREHALPAGTEPVAVGVPRRGLLEARLRHRDARAFRGFLELHDEAHPAERLSLWRREHETRDHKAPARVENLELSDRAVAGVRLRTGIPAQPTVPARP